VVITGMGVLAANGIGVSAFWESLLAGRSGIGPITLFDAQNQNLRIAGEIKNFHVRDYLGSQVNEKRVGRHTQLALVGTQMAIEDAGLTRAELTRQARVPLFFGVSTCAMDLIESGMHRLFDHGAARFSPYIVSNALPHGVTNTVAQYLAINADGRTLSSACQSGAESLYQGAQLIRSGQSDLVIAGGVDAPMTAFTIAAFSAGGLRPASYDEQHPEKASRPFDLHRTGGVLAEGAAVLVLEHLDRARERGATVYAELTGTSTASDPYGSEPTSGLSTTMRDALYNAGITPGQIDYINAHGPSEPVMDYVETKAIKDVFAHHARRIPISSIKGVTGNALAAQGPMQVIATLLAMRDQTIPPTANLETPDPQCDLDYTPLTPRKGRIDRALVNAHGLGGGNTSMVLEHLPTP
jgi:3-oxoacyl-[acyl-carrier-protein] synthase II